MTAPETRGDAPTANSHDPLGSVEHALRLVATLSSEDAQLASSDVDGSFNREQLQLAALTELVSRISSAANGPESCQTLADELAAYFNAKQVFVATCRTETSCELTAVSNQKSVDRKSEISRFALAAIQEGVTRGEIGVWPPKNQENRHALLAHKQFAKRIGGENCAVTSALRDDRGVVRGACLVVVASEFDVSAAVRFLAAAERPVASAIGLQLRAEGNRLTRFVTQALEGLRARKSQWIMGMFALLMLVLAVPLQYKVKCDCEVQPVVRRFVAAPFEGRLEKSFVEPGDVVSTGDVLARIDGREINWELSGKRADVHRVEKQRDGHIAAHESGAVEIARLEIERLLLEIKRLEDQAANLEIRSPVDGMVVSGDLSKSEGVPLEKGQSLFEIAPLEEMAIEIAVPEDDVRFVKVGMTTHIGLDAFPMKWMDARLERVHPRAELRGHENVFIAEVSIENAQGRLRPGMRGTAKVVTVQRPLGWILFHKACSAAFSWFGW